MKICFIASSGGHLEQLLMLEPLMKKYNSFIVTEKTNYCISIDGIKTYYLNQVNRKKISIVCLMIVNFIKSLIVIIKEKPDVVISTGALCVVPMCLLIKFLNRKLIFVESIAKVSSPTKTGKLLYNYADRFYVQWESMLEFYPKAVYLGGIY